MLIKKTNTPSAKKQKITGLICLIITPVLLFVLTEMLNVNGISVFQTPVTFFLNLLFFAFIEVFLCFITKRSDIAIAIMTILFVFLAVINGYVVEFRGYGFMFSDIHSVETATNMIDEFIYTLNITQVLSIIIAFFFIRLSFNNVVIFNHRMIGSLVSGVVAISYIVMLSCTPFLGLLSIEPNFYYSHANGFYVNFLGTIWIANQDKAPPNYSVENVIEEYNKVKTEYDENYKTTNSVMPENIICIMNESLADLTVYENFTADNPLQYILSLNDNAISGYTYASVYGGTTVISEYEFLTNNTSQFFGSTMSPYSTFVDEKSFSLAKQLGTYGYESTFLHPYKSISYNRPYAYEGMGFDNQYYETEMKELFNPECCYADSEIYKAIEKITETNGKSFIFTITMQNHIPYTFMDDQNLTIQDSQYNEYVDKYLSLAKESDNAFKELIEYYSNCDEPTIIVMFGDHQPKLGQEFWESVSGKSLSSLLVDESQILYKTPFVIWANYPIDEKQNVNVSINYLSTLMIEQTNIPKTVYQYCLSNIMSELPIINNNGFIDKDGNSYLRIEDLPTNLQKLANLYNMFEYNLAFDKENIVYELNLP